MEKNKLHLNIRDLKILGVLIRERRLAIGWDTQQPLATAAGVSTSYISSVETGSRTSISRNQIKRICTPLGIGRDEVPESLRWPIEDSDKSTADILRTWADYGVELATMFDDTLPGSRIPLSALYQPPRAEYSELWGRLSPEIKDHIQNKNPAENYSFNSRRKKKRASIEEISDSEEIRLVCDLDAHLSHWAVGNTNRADCLRLVRGGPGSGKSSAAKKLVRTLVETNPPDQLPEILVVLIPLQHVPFRTANLIDALDLFVTNTLKLQGFSFRKNEIPDHIKRVILVLDGLDELSADNSQAADLSQSLLDEVSTWVKNTNYRRVNVQCVVFGRDGAMTGASRRLSLAMHQELRIIPYLTDSVFVDPDGIAKQDLRKNWWDAWCRLPGNTMEPWPEALDGGVLRELSAEPLSLFIIVLFQAYDENLSEIKSRGQVFELVLERIISGWHHKAQSDGKDTRFQVDEELVRLLEIIGAAAWTDSGRVTTGKRVDSFKNKTERAREGALQMTERHAILKAVLSFYLSYTDEDQDIGIEFTHKSFADYLAARYLVRNWHENFVLRHERDFWQSFQAWTDSFKGGKVTVEVAGFIKDHCAESDRMNSDLPESLSRRNLLPTLGETIKELAWQRDLDIQPLVAYSLIFSYLSQFEASRVKPAWLSMHDTRDLLSALNVIAQKKGTQIRENQLYPIFDTVTYWHDWFVRSDFDGQALSMASFIEMNLFDCNFAGCGLTGARYINSNLVKANFTNADLRGAVFHGSNLTHANFKDAKLDGADFRLANGIRAEQFDGAGVTTRTLFPKIPRGAQQDPDD